MEESIVLFVLVVFLYCLISIRSLEKRLSKLEIHYVDLEDRYKMWLLTELEDNQNKKR